MKNTSIFTIVTILSLFFANTSHALEIGSQAPDFKAQSTSGKEASLKDFKGQWLVLYFFPKAFTPGCNAQACSLRDRIKSISKEQAVVLGVSLDSVKTQKKFKEKYSLPFEFVSDKEKIISKAYDVLGFLGLYAKRSTFIISPKGKIAHIIKKAGTKNHSIEVIEILKTLKSK